MRQLIRSLTFGIAATLAGVGMAQYTVTVQGQIANCAPGDEVILQTTPGTTPFQSVTIPMAPGYCGYGYVFSLDSPSGGIEATLNCSGGNTTGDSVGYAFNDPYDSTGLNFNLLSCDPNQPQYSLVVHGTVPDCLPNTLVTVETLPGTTPYQQTALSLDNNCQYFHSMYLDSGTGGLVIRSTCSDGSAIDDTVFFTIPMPNVIGYVVVNLICDTTITPCNACVLVAQDSTIDGVVPFGVQLSSCSSGCEEPYTYNWSVQGSSVSNLPNPTYLFDGPGTYNVCLAITDVNGYYNAACVAVLVDANGMISMVNTVPCSANFLVAQALAVDSLNPQDTTGILPIPNEVWVYDLSVGLTFGTDYVWDFGDGTSSTDPYPTHVYDGDGPWILCLTMTSNFCTDTYCDTVSVDANGMLNGMIVDGHSTGTVSNDASRSGGFTLNVIQEIPTGITETPALAEMNLWPNPVGNELNLDFNSIRAGSSTISVINTDGSKVLQVKRAVVLGKNTVKLNTASLAPGLYLLRMGVGAQQLAHRFLKTR